MAKRFEPGGDTTDALTALFFSLRFYDQTETGRIRWDPPIPAASRPDRSVIVFMNSDLLAVLDYMEREKGIKREVSA